MKNVLLFIFLCILLSPAANAQWSTGTPYTFLTPNTTNRVGIGTTSPSIGRLQIGSPGNTDSNKIVIPGVYNFEKAKFGEYYNGAAGLEFINHWTSSSSYGVRLLANVDQTVPGLQLQYAPIASTEGGLSYSAGMFMRADNGNIGIGTTNPGNKLQIADGADDASSYGSVQIIRATNPGDYRFHLAFVRSSQMVSGIGYVSGTNTLGIWAGVNTNSTVPLISFLQNQSVGIGTVNPQSLLAVKGTVTAQKVIVTQTGWADYVFDSSYRLRSLDTVENFIQDNKHLPDVPSAKQIETEGSDLADNQRILLQKIEELTLYIIRQNKKIESMQADIDGLKKKQP